jgi:hypothetical protein
VAVIAFGVRDGYIVRRYRIRPGGENMNCDYDLFDGVTGSLLSVGTE